MDIVSANNFMDNLIKNIQMLCHGHIPFVNNVEVIGHIYLNIDCGKKLNYILNEKCSKASTSLIFTSNSFHASPGNENPSKPKKQKTSTVVSPEGTPSKISKRSDETNLKQDHVDEYFDASTEEADSQEFDDSSGQHMFVDPASEDEDDDNPTKSEISCTSTDAFNTEASIKNVNISGLLHDVGQSDNIDYSIIEMGTQQGRPMLVDNIGYSYNLRVKERADKCATWRCTVRNKKIRCAATVSQKGDQFIRGKHEHSHDPKAGLLTSVLITAEARAQASNDFITPISDVVERVMSVKGTEDEAALPKICNLKRMINRHRQISRKSCSVQDPGDLNFEET
ncbi:uncharacterized protein LOC126816060 isoform X2 [Patella vulgata]|uniref:uncharacterized protein LOC126816060 isoform X2 n=1 Tax=Patella vulgata TaxID=6465 RepID=UPI00218018F3|nr:uncharacterized protein LOC126816060 isoform X2 [Patella vulgata]